jgi:hypothetical protein
MQGEFGVEIDTGKFKVGDGTTLWNSLAYSSGDNGTSGSSGNSGTSGSSGISGSSGTSGTSGVSGSSGTAGISGSSGTSGNTGSSGSSGTSGLNGSSGSSGASGTSGSSGESGSSGTTGTSGSSGTSGTSGSSGTSGLNGLSNSLFNYQAKTGTTSGDPSSGHIIWDNATQASATQINISEIDNNGNNVDLFMSNLVSGSLITIQDKSDHTKYQKWHIGTAVDNSTYWTVPISLVQSTIEFSNNTDVLFIIVTVPSGTSGTSGQNGSSGSSGTSGVSGSSGSSGTSGVSGSSGTSGNTGSSGTSGVDGVATNIINSYTSRCVGSTFQSAANTFAKSGSNGWDGSGMYTEEGYFAAYISGKPVSNNNYFYIGMTYSEDPGPVYSNVNYGWYFLQNSNLQIAEAGGSTVSMGNYNTSSYYSIFTDGYTVSYYIDNDLAYSHQTFGTGALYADVAMHDSGSKVTDLMFGSFGGFGKTGSTSSYAQIAATASYLAGSIQSASYAITASYALNGGGGGGGTTIVSGAYYDITSSYAVTASYVLGGGGGGGGSSPSASYFSSSALIIDTTPKAFVDSSSYNSGTGIANIDMRVATMFDIDIAAATTLTITSSNMDVGRTAMVRIKNSSAYNATCSISLPTGWTYIGGVRPTAIPGSRTSFLSISSFGSTDADVACGYTFNVVAPGM